MHFEVKHNTGLEDQSHSRLPYMVSETQIRGAEAQTLGCCVIWGQGYSSSPCERPDQAHGRSVPLITLAAVQSLQRSTCMQGMLIMKDLLQEGVADLLAKPAEIGQRHQPCSCNLRGSYVRLVSIPCCTSKHTLHLLQPSEGMSDAQSSTDRPCTSPQVQLCNTGQVTCEACARLPLLAEPEDLSAQGQVRRHALQVIHAHKLPVAQLHLAVPV